MRGCTCVEQSVLGGLAHLLNFKGTDTMSAAYYGQFKLNGAAREQKTQKPKIRLNNTSNRRS